MVVIRWSFFFCFGLVFFSLPFFLVSARHGWGMHVEREREHCMIDQRIVSDFPFFFLVRLLLLEKRKRRIGAYDVYFQSI